MSEAASSAASELARVARAGQVIAPPLRRPPWKGDLVRAHRSRLVPPILGLGSLIERGSTLTLGDRRARERHPDDSWHTRDHRDSQSGQVLRWRGGGDGYPSRMMPGFLTSATIRSWESFPGHRIYAIIGESPGHRESFLHRESYDRRESFPVIGKVCESREENSPGHRGAFPVIGNVCDRRRTLPVRGRAFRVIEGAGSSGDSPGRRESPPVSGMMERQENSPVTESFPDHRESLRIPGNSPVMGRVLSPGDSRLAMQGGRGLW